jgi:hypothetical protein
MVSRFNEVSSPALDGFLAWLSLISVGTGGTSSVSQVEPEETKWLKRGESVQPFAHFYFGTGSVLTLQLVEPFLRRHTNAGAERLVSRVESVPPEPTVDVRGQLTLIRSSFGLSITELAQVLKVERPTIYTWLRQTVRPHEQNRRRLDLVYELADFWRSLSSASLAHLRHQRVPGGSSLLELLVSENVDTERVKSWLRAVGRSASRAPGLRLRDRAAESGGQIVAVPGAREEIDRMTGKRVNDE